MLSFNALKFIISALLVIVSLVSSEDIPTGPCYDLVKKIKTPGAANSCAMLARVNACLDLSIPQGSFMKLCKVCFQSPAFELTGNTPITESVCCCQLPWVLANYNNFGSCVSEVGQFIKQDPNFCML